MPHRKGTRSRKEEIAPPKNSVPTYLGGLGPEADALRQALRLAIEHAASAGLAAITIAVPALGNTQGIFEDTLGEETTKVLRRDYRFERNGFTVHLATKRNPPSSLGPVVAAWTTSEQTHQLLTNPRVTELLYVPWSEDDVESFLRITNDPVRY